MAVAAGGLTAALQSCPEGASRQQARRNSPAHTHVFVSAAAASASSSQSTCVQSAACTDSQQHWRGCTRGERSHPSMQLAGCCCLQFNAASPIQSPKLASTPPPILTHTPPRPTPHTQRPTNHYHKKWPSAASSSAGARASPPSRRCSGPRWRPLPGS